MLINQKFIADFWDTRSATSTIELLDQSTRGDVCISVRYYVEAVDGSLPVASRSFRRVQSGPAHFTLGSAAERAPSGLFRAGTVAEKNEDVFGPYIRTPSRVMPSETAWTSTRDRLDHRASEGSSYATYRIPEHRSSQDVFGGPSTVDDRFRDGLIRHGGFNRKAVPPDNRVYPDRIAQGMSISGLRRLPADVPGQEFRTTVMVKDVPVSCLV